MILRTIASHKGFSILIALGSIGVLLIIVTSLATIYINELKLSRMQYNNILASAQAEGVFEYAMLKVTNHREGFEDRMDENDLDTQIFRGSTPRTSGTSVKYQIESQSTDHDFSFSGHLIVPLFSGTGVMNLGSTHSYDPRKYSGIVQVRQLDFNIQSGNPDTISWSIVAMSGGQNVSIAGTGEIDVSTRGVSRFRSVDCYDGAGVKEPLNIDGTCPNTPRSVQSPSGTSILNPGETLEYFYDDTSSTVTQFLSHVQNPYLMIFNSGTVLTGSLKTDQPFTLPQLTITTEAHKANTTQVIRFSEDKSKYYDAIRYGIYNNN